MVDGVTRFGKDYSAHIAELQLELEPILRPSQSDWDLKLATACLAVMRPIEFLRSGSQRVRLRLQAKRVTSTPEFAMLEFHPLAGKIVAGRPFM